MALFIYFTLVNTFFIGFIFMNSIFKKPFQIMKYISKKILYISGFKYEIPDLSLSEQLNIVKQMDKLH
jgi:hypothetical protein